MTFGGAHNPAKPPPWLIDLHPSGLVAIRRRGARPAPDTDVVFEAHSYVSAAEARDRLCIRHDKRYRLREPMSAREARAAFARAARGIPA